MLFMVYRSVLKLFGLVFILFIVVRCAQPGTPGGGPKDTMAPEVLATEPLNGSANFTDNKFVIYFDEFVQLDNITQKVMISPPMDKMPDFKLKGKSLHVKFNDELKENTTYTVYFGDAIADLNEKNPILNFTYIFSTGPTVDSMSITGMVRNSFDLQAVEDVFVMLYKDNNDTLPLDSLPLAVKPFYLSKTDVNGDFQLNGLANETFLMFAIIDMNGNYFYDQPGEEIAFLDSIIQPQFIDIPVIDTSILDSLITDFDQLSPDSIEALIDSIYHDSLHASLDKLTKYTLNFFAEDDTTQRLEKAELMQKNILRFSFSRPADEITMESINFNPDTVWYKEEFTPNKDTIFWYLKELPFDTLEIVFKHRGDTLEHEYIRVNPRKAFPAGETRKQKKEDEKKKEYFGYSFNLQSGILRLNAQPMVTFVSPVADFYTDSVLLVKGDDSLYNPEFIFIDSMHRKILFPIELEESMRYSIILPDSSFTDWNGYINKGNKMTYSTLSLRDYGVLSLSLKPKIKQPYILQLMTDKEALLKEFYFKNDTSFSIEYLDPGKYLIKLIYDDNGNRKWDTGNYNEKRQPERVFYYQKELTIRGNWEIEEEWVIPE